MKRAPIDSFSYEEEEPYINKRQKITNSSDVLIVYEDELLFNNDHIVPTEPSLSQTLESTLDIVENAEESLDGYAENIWSASLLDLDRAFLGTLQFSFVDDGFSLEGGFL